MTTPKCIFYVFLAKVPGKHIGPKAVQILMLKCHPKFFIQNDLKINSKIQRLIKPSAFLNCWSCSLSSFGTLTFLAPSTSSFPSPFDFSFSSFFFLFPFSFSFSSSSSSSSSLELVLSLILSLGRPASLSLFSSTARGYFLGYLISSVFLNWMFLSVQYPCPLSS